jgi:hypothetical protein
LEAKRREREARFQAIDAEIRSLQPVSRLPVAVIENRLAEWRRLLRGSTAQGPQGDSRHGEDAIVRDCGLIPATIAS